MAAPIVVNVKLGRGLMAARIEWTPPVKSTAKDTGAVAADNTHTYFDDEEVSTPSYNLSVGAALDSAVRSMYSSLTGQPA